jgi:hypothetical protein
VLEPDASVAVSAGAVVEALSGVELDDESVGETPSGVELHDDEFALSGGAKRGLRNATASNRAAIASRATPTKIQIRSMVSRLVSDIFINPLLGT